MLTVIIRVVFIFFILLLVIRMMGKRQIGEMEPFELAITLVIAELACVPMADKSIPLTYGIISILTMYVVHQIIILLSKQNRKFQGVVSGIPVIVIDKNGVKYDALKSMNMQMTDLLQAMRAAGYFCLDQIVYAIFETNGQLSVIADPEKADSTTLPVPIVVDGKLSQADVEYHKIDVDPIVAVMKKHNLDFEDIILATIDENGKLLIHPQNEKFFVTQLNEVKNG